MLFARENKSKLLLTLKQIVNPKSGCMRITLSLLKLQMLLGPGALGRPGRIGWRGRWEGGSGWGIHVNPWLIHVNV